ncbi:MAG: NAD-dependent epimerase/dehydratase family protein [Chthoniobacterales bacterium]
MPRVLVVGYGYVGRAAADLFHKSGWGIEAWRASAEASPATYPIVTCDVSDASAVAARTGDFDVVLQCVSSKGGDADAYRAIYLRGAINLRKKFPDALLLFTSSTSVYAQRGGEWVNEESPTEPTRETSSVLVETEQVVLGGGGTVARLAGIYGPERSFMLDQLLSGRARIPVNDRYVNQVHRDDIATALFLLANKPRRGEIFNVVDDAPTSSRACYEWLAQSMHMPIPPAAADSQPRKRGDSNKRVSNAKLRNHGWQLRYPRFEIGMAESVIPQWKTVKEDRYRSCSR